MFTKTLAAALVLAGSLPTAGCAELLLRPAAVTVHAVDQDGNPVKSQAYAFCPYDDSMDEKSIESGTASLTTSIVAPILVIGVGEKGAKTIQKGYYEDRRINYVFSDRTRPLTHWSPWNPDVYLVSKKVKTPVPMYIPSIGSSLYSDKAGINLTWPVPIGEEIGFDFIAADWVGPHGRGTVADVFIKVEDEDSSQPRPKKSSMVNLRFLKTTLRFPGRDDGLVPFRPLFKLGEGDNPIGSVLWHDYEAPRTGYISKFVSDPEAEEAAQRIERPKDAGPNWSKPTRSYDKLILRRGTTKECGFTAYGSGPEAEAAFQRLIETGWVFVRHSAYFRIHSKRLESGEVIGMHGVMDTDALARWCIDTKPDLHVEVRLRYKLNPDMGSRSLEWNGINLSKPYSRDPNAPSDYMIGVSPLDKPRVHDLQVNPRPAECP